MTTHGNRSPSQDVSNIAVPDKLKCSLCNKYKSKASYSNKEINDWKFNQLCAKSGPPPKKEIRCRGCAGGPKMEMMCTTCYIVQGLENFSKTQRSEKNARCKDCVNWHDVTEPGVLPLAAPETETAPDEDYIEGDNVNLDDLDIEGDADSDEDEKLLCRKADLLSVVDSAKSDTYLSTNSKLTSSVRFEGASDSKSTDQGYHSTSSPSNPYENHSTSSPSNPYETSGSIPGSYNISTPSWSTPRPRSMASSHNGSPGTRGPVSTAPKIEYTKYGWPKKQALGPKAQVNPKPEFHINRGLPKSKMQIGVIDDDDESDDEI